MNNSTKKLLLNIDMASYPEYDKDILILGLHGTPSLTQLSRQFKSLALERHPDKIGGSNEAFQELYTSYKRLGVYLSKTSNVDRVSNEEATICNFFRQFNEEKEKLQSTVILIENNLSNPWDAVLTIQYGNPKIISSNGVPTGKKWDILKYNGGKNIFISKYKNPKSDGRSKLHIQGRDHILFTANQLPSIYKLVINYKETKPLENSQPTPKDVRRRLQ